MPLPRLQEDNSVQHARTTMSGLMVIIALASAFTFPGCSEDIDSVILDDVQRRSFAFTDGAVFHPGLANMPVTLNFIDNIANFTLTSARGTAQGFSNFSASCLLTVLSTTYEVGAGPQVFEEMRLELCDFDTANNTLIIGNGTTTAISAPAVPL
jgi:hypothetical protein